MSLQSIEEIMYLMSDFFMAPVILILVVLFIYSLFALGQFGAQYFQRKLSRHSYLNTINGLSSNKNQNELSGYPLVSHAVINPRVTKDELDVLALELLDGVRMVSRLSPMLGLIATMIPMGPALKSLADGNIQGISENLIIAFSAVIFGLVIASITFWIACVKKRWLATELVAVTSMLEASSDLKVVQENLNEAA